MGDAVLEKEGFERRGSHRLVVFEDGVQAYDGQRRALEHALQALGLRNAVTDAAWAEHLEGVQRDDPAPQRAQGEVRRRAEPPGDEKPRKWGLGTE